MGIKQIIISTEENPVVSVRAKKLEITCLQGINDKKTVLIIYCNENKKWFPITLVSSLYNLPLNK